MESIEKDVTRSVCRPLCHATMPPEHTATSELRHKKYSASCSWPGQLWHRIFAAGSSKVPMDSQASATRAAKEVVRVPTEI